MLKERSKVVKEGKKTEGEISVMLFPESVNSLRYGRPYERYLILLNPKFNDNNVFGSFGISVKEFINKFKLSNSINSDKSISHIIIMVKNIIELLQLSMVIQEVL